MITERRFGVYFARGLLTGLVKIGSSAALAQRAATLSAKVGEPVEVFAAFRSALPGFTEERELHQRFARLRATDAGRGQEWFRDDGTIAAFVASLPSECRGSYTRTAGTMKTERRKPRVAQPSFIRRAGGVR